MTVFLLVYLGAFLVVLEKKLVLGQCFQHSSENSVVPEIELWEPEQNVCALALCTIFLVLAVKYFNRLIIS